LTVDDPTRTARHEQAAATRRQLLAAAVAVFEERGYQGATVGAITDRASTAHGTFYLYFRNKEDAFCRVMEAVIVDEFAAEVMVPLTDEPRVAIEGGIGGFVAFYHRHVGLWRALLEGMLASPRVLELWLELRRDLVLRLSQAFEAQQKAGIARPFDPTMAAHSLAAMAEWSSFTHLVLGQPGGEESRGPDGGREALVETLSDLWYRGLYGRVPEDDAG